MNLLSVPECRKATLLPKATVAHRGGGFSIGDTVKRSDITEKRFGKLTAIKWLRIASPSRASVWLCRCDCGKEAEVRLNNLSSGHTRSCGCLSDNLLYSPKFLDMAGMRFGMLLVLGYSRTVNKKAMWRCKCDCGTACEVTGSYMRCGHTASCGCFRAIATAQNKTTHGMTSGGRKQGTYRSWQDMKQRCLNKKHMHYQDYGGRGIAICKRWVNSFDDFFSDMGKCPDGYTLGRKENNGNYEPGNCRWETYIEQGANKRNNLLLTLNGKTLTISQWARELRMPLSTIQTRRRRGLPVELCLIPYTGA